MGLHYLSGYTMRIEAISNGLGAQSMYMLCMAAEGRIPARLSITADTGWENDRTWMDGTKSSSREYFEMIVRPYAIAHGIEAIMVGAVTKAGEPVPTLGDWTRQYIEEGKINHVKIPLFGSNGGRLRQPCTSRKKIAAIRQELRRRGATSARMAHGLHRGEFHRMKGVHGRMEEGFYTLTSMDAQWMSHYYPIIDEGLFRPDVSAELVKRGIPYLLSSECDGCPHKDWPRWARTSQAVIDDIADMEEKMGGQFFFTVERIPIKEALPIMQRKWEEKHLHEGQMDLFDDPDFGCDEGGVCGV
jgi:hypothetical protein